MDRYSTLMVGSWSPAPPQGGGTVRYPQQVLVLSNTKDPLSKRARPKGIDILFSGTDVNSYKSGYNVGLSTLPSTSGLTGSWQVCGVPVYPGRVATAPLNGVYSTSDWGNQLRSKLLDQSVNFAVTAAEYKATARMFEDYGSRIVKAYRSIRKGSPSGVYKALSGSRSLPRDWKANFSRHATSVAAENWLAFNYGVKPLISDIKGSIAEYYKVRGVRPIIRSVSMGLPGKSYSDFSYGSAQSSQGTARTDWAQISQSGHLVCYAEFNDDAGRWDATAARLGLTNPAELLWELIPFSFVVDWFLQVGDFLHAAQTIKGLKRVGVHVSSRLITSGYRQHGGLSSFKIEVSRRRFYSSLPTPALSWGTGASSASRAFSGLALLRVQSRGNGSPSLR